MSPLPSAVKPPVLPAPPRPRAEALETLHPALWRAHQVGRGGERVRRSGFDTLDAHLPGGGWPHKVLTELLLPHAGVGEVRLLAPALAATLRDGRTVMLFDPPACLSAWALLQAGVDAEQLLVIYTRRSAGSAAPGLRGADSHVEAGGNVLWALEQSLKSGHVGALLAWLPPRLAPERLRRLQLAAEAHDGPAFMLREAAAVSRPSAAPLRLALQSAGPDRLAVQVLKRRGPLLTQPLLLSLAPGLTGWAVGSALASRRPGRLPPLESQAGGSPSRQSRPRGGSPAALHRAEGVAEEAMAEAGEVANGAARDAATEAASEATNEAANEATNEAAYGTDLPWHR